MVSTFLPRFVQQRYNLVERAPSESIAGPEPRRSTFGKKWEFGPDERALHPGL
jgi:hypothetical protein